MNPVLLLTKNNLELSKRCVESVRKQDIPTSLFIFDNGSTDGTKEWLRDEKIWTFDLDHRGWDSSTNVGVSTGWNNSLSHLFGLIGLGRCEYVLVVGNDTILPTYCFSALLSANVPFVTGVDIGMNPLPDKADIFPLSPHPDFSCFLISRGCWRRVGLFDERMRLYASDCDYHIRAHRLGIPLYKANIPYQHERSSTMNRATPEERAKINEQANKDRAVFQSLYGCLPGQPAYDNLFSKEAFGIDKK